MTNISTSKVINEYFNNTKLINDLIIQEMDMKELNECNYAVGTSSKQAEKQTCITVDFEGEQELDLAGMHISPFDRCVMDSVYTIYYMYKGGEISSPCCTDDDIIRIMYGRLGADNKVTNQKVDALHESLNKLRRIVVTIDVSEDYSKTKFDGKLYLRDNMIHVKEIIYAGRAGREKHFYKILDYPVLNLYANYKNHVIKVSSDKIDIPGLSATEENMLITRYLIRRIEAMKNPHNKISSATILLRDQDKLKRTTGLYREAGLDPNNISRDKKSNVMRTVRKVLDHYVSIGYIGGYRLQFDPESPKSVRGLEITGVMPDRKSLPREAVGKNRTKRDKGKTRPDTQTVIASAPGASEKVTTSPEKVTTSPEKVTTSN